MNSLYHASDVSEIIRRMERLEPGTSRQWGKMNAVQMLAHCHVAMEMALGKTVVKRLLIGRLIGTFLKRGALSKKPFVKNSPTDKSFVFAGNDHLSFNEEKAKLIQSIREFAGGGPSRCTTHPHPFFGKYTPDEWAVLQWKHLDHHLRQFGV